MAEGCIVDLFIEHGARQRFDSGERIINAGAPAAAVFLVDSGAAKVSVVSKTGSESLLEVREAGSLLGEMSAILGGGRSAAADGLVAGELLRVPIDMFRRQLDDAAFTRALLVETARRLRTASLHQHEIAVGTSRSRVARVLADLATRVGDTQRTQSRLGALTQQDVADFAGVSRDSAVRALSEFRAAGWIHTARRTITILDLPAIERVGEI
ncbi:MAG: Crp/Fnr family transcriptional regulator [Actinomycetota bacterium]